MESQVVGSRAAALIISHGAPPWQCGRTPSRPPETRECLSPDTLRDVRVLMSCGRPVACVSQERQSLRGRARNRLYTVTTGEHDTFTYRTGNNAGAALYRSARSVGVLGGMLGHRKAIGKALIAGTPLSLLDIAYHAVSASSLQGAHCTSSLVWLCSSVRRTGVDSVVPPRCRPIWVPPVGCSGTGAVFSRNLHVFVRRWKHGECRRCAAGRR